MAKVRVVVKEKEETQPAPWAEMTRKAVLAGMGALSLAQEQASELFDRMVDRGETVEQDGRRMARDLMNRRRRQAELTRTAFEERVEQVAGGMSIPTRTDLEELSAKISALTEKIDELKEKQKGQ